MLGTDFPEDRLPADHGRAQLIEAAPYLRGADVRYGCALDSFESGPEGVRIETSDGGLQADVLVNAAGAWAGADGASSNRRALRRRVRFIDSRS